jgi:hypothetical protein
MRFQFLDVLCFVLAVHAVSLPFAVHHSSSRYSIDSKISKRDVLSVKNIANSVYVSNVTLGGKTIPVMLDTGR